MKFEIPDPEDIFGEIEEGWEPSPSEIATMVRAWGEANDPEVFEGMPYWHAPDEFDDDDLDEFAEFIPQIDPHERPAWMTLVHDAMDDIDVLDAYRRWCGKMEPKVAPGQTENIHISCPIPGHEDKKPSAWMNVAEGLWYCGRCERGGDSWDLASFRHNVDIGVGGNRNGIAFIELMGKVAGDFGIEVAMVDGRTVLASELPEVSDEDEAEETLEGPKASETPAVIPTRLAQEHHQAPKRTWRELVPQGTFIHEYIRCGTQEDSVIPHEWHAAMAMLACGLAVGQDVDVRIGVETYRPNLFVCLYGATGVGKSRSINMMRKVVKRAFPYDWEDPRVPNVKIIANPGSAEALMDEFSEKTIDEITGEETLWPVRGLLVIDELAELAAKSARRGSSITPMMIRLYDAIEGIDAQRSRTGGLIQILDPFCTSVFSVQPKALGRLYTKGDIDNGWLNRITFVGGSAGEGSSPWNRTEADWDHAVLLLQRIRSMYDQHVSRHRGKFTITFTEGGVDAYEEFWVDQIKPIIDAARAAQNREEDEDPAYGSIARVPMNFNKLLTCMAVNECVTEIDANLVRRTIELLWEPLCQNAIEVFADISTDETDDIINKLVTHMNGRNASQGKTVAVPAWGKRGVFTKKEFRGHSQERLAKALEVAAKTGRLRTSTNPQGDRILWVDYAP